MPYYRPSGDRISGRFKGRGLFGYTPDQIQAARKNLDGPVARSIGRYLARRVNEEITIQVQDSAASLRAAIERSGIIVTGGARRSVRARGTGAPSNPNAQPTRRTIDVEYAPYLKIVSDGSGPQKFPPARKRGGRLIYTREEAQNAGPAHTAMFSNTTNPQYGLLDWIEMKGMYSEKYPDQFDLYRAIGMKIKRSGISPQHIFEDAWDAREWWQQKDVLFDTGYDIALNFGQGAQNAATDQWWNVLLTFYRGGNLPAGLIAEGPSTLTMAEVSKFAGGRVYPDIDIRGRY